MEAQEGHVIAEVIHRVSYIEFYHPAQNSMPGHLLKKLVATITEEGRNEASDIIVLKSFGDRTYCAGASFTELASIRDFDTGKAFFLGFANVINAIRLCPKIVIGRVQGKAVGGGVGLAAACDFTMATKFASVRLSELAVGIGPFVIGPAVERKIGLSAFSQMSLQAAEWQTAAWAKQKGLFMEVFETVEQLDDYLSHFINELLSRSPRALAGLKEVFWQGTEHWSQLLEQRAEASGKLILSDYAKNAIAEFLQKNS